MNSIKKKRKLRKTRLFTIVFSILFIVSLFSSIVGFAKAYPLEVTDADITDKADSVTASISDVEKDEITGSEIFHKVNGFVSYNFKIKSNESKEITIISITDDNNNQYINYEYDKHENQKLQSGESFDFAVKAVYKNELTDMSKRDQISNVKFIIKYLVAEDERQSESDITINPKTGDNTNISFILLIISSVGIVSCIALDKKKNNKKLSKASIFVMTGLLLTPFITKAATYSYNVLLKNNIGLYDKNVITYVINGVEHTLTNGYGDVISGLETPTEDGYVFEKWVNEDGSDFDPTKPITEDLKITAKMNAIEYTISYDLNGGNTTTNNPTTYKITDKIELVEPTKDNYTFIGWTGTDLTEPTKNLVIENKFGNRSYTANYAPKDYSITYNGLTSQEISTLNNPTSYNIETSTFTLNNPVDRVDNDGDVTERFVGWKSGSTTSTTITLPNTNDMGNKTYEAQWVAADETVYTITYTLNGGTTETANPVEFTKTTPTFTLVNPTKEGYTFKGWSGTDLTGDNNLEVQVAKGTRKNLSFEANYIANNYEVVFNKNGSNVSGNMSNQTFTYDTPDNLEQVAFTREGYTFDSWNTEEDGSGTAYDDQDEITNLTSTKDGQVNLYAQWTANSYKVRFNANESTAEGTMNDLDMVYDTPKALTLNMFTVQGYTFDSWNTKADGTGTKITNGEEVNNLASSGITEIYAQWKPNTDTAYTVEYYQENANDNNYTLAETDYPTGTTDTQASATIRSYEHFTYDSNNSQNVLNGNIERDGSLVLKVYYSRNKQTIEFNSNGGTEFNSIERKYGSTLLLTDLPTPTYGTKIFLGWFTEEDGGDLIDSNITVNEDKILYAHWQPTTLCVKATDLHSDTCERTDNGGCHKAGYYSNGSHGTSTIVYGNTAGDELQAGDAFNCDVNGDGVYDSDTERFYYIRSNNGKAVMVFFSNFEGEDGIKTTDNYVYADVHSKLPTMQQWSNVLTEYDGYAARLLQVADVEAACGISPNTSDFLTQCDYMLENTSFKIDDTSVVRTGIWLESENSTYYRLQSQVLQFVSIQASSKNVARPVIDVPLSLVDQDPLPEYTVNFDSKGGSFLENPGSSILVKDVTKGGVIRILPVPQKENATFQGWYTDTTYSQKIEQPLIVNSNATYYAKWSYTNYAALIGDSGYETLQEAVTAVSTTATEPTTIVLLKDVQESVTIAGGRKVELDLQGYTVSNSGNTNVIIVDNGELEMYNGTLTSTAATNGVINVNEHGTLTIRDLTINGNGGKQAIYNDGGTTYIMDGSNITGVATERAVVHNKNNGTMKITGGTIIGTKMYAVYNENGSLTIGTKDHNIDKDSPIIQGKTYGIVANPQFAFYDGTIKGETAPIGKTTGTGNTPAISVDTGETKISDIEDGTEKINDVDGDYKILYLAHPSNKYVVTLDPGNGTVSPTTIIVEPGDPVGFLPIALNGVYTFDGWYDSTTDQPVDANTIPEGNVTFYAKWSFTPTHSQFSIINEPMKVYFNNISTWKNDESTFQTTMNNNFDEYSCQSCDANASSPYQTCPINNEANKKQCDRAEGFETGVTSDITVYLSDETTKEKGAEVDYVTVTNGTIYNMIPGETYYWESDEDNNVYGTVTVSGQRRIIDAGAVRNVRDLGGLEVDTNNDGTPDGTLKYGKIFRGVRLATSEDITSLERLGITEEIDLRGNESDPKLSNYVPFAITNYEIDKENYSSNYTALRNALTKAMDDVINGENIYFHCKIGTDRTGTFAYFLEGLLGVSEEDRLQDYELSYFYGVLNRHRFYSYQPGSSITHRFTYMHNLYPTNQDIYDYYMSGSTNQEADIQRINNFRNAMINQ